MNPDAVPRFRLFLLRHAHAAWPLPDTSDFDRPLTDLGRSEARDVAEQALLAGLVPDVLICSPARRCRQTADAFTAFFNGLEPVEDPALYAGDADAYISAIRRAAGRTSLLLIGHNPVVEALAHQLTRTSPVLAPLALGYPTAGLLTIQFPVPLPADLERAGEATDLIMPSFA